MTSEQFARMSELETALRDLQRSYALWEAARVMEIDEGDEERADALYSIFGERISGEIKRLEEVYDELWAFLVEDGKVGF